MIIGISSYAIMHESTFFEKKIVDFILRIFFFFILIEYKEGKRRTKERKKEK